MNRVHIHINAPDLAEARRYYTALLGAGPTVEKDDYLKWRLDDPAVNLSVVADEPSTGLMHLGLDFGSSGGLDGLRARLEDEGLASQPEEGAHCCYARSDKQWLEDPAGVIWEAFYTYGEGDRLHGDKESQCCGQADAACCA